MAGSLFSSASNMIPTSLTLTETYFDIAFLDKLCNQRPDSQVKREHISCAKSLAKRLRGTNTSEVKYEVKKYKIRNGETASIGRLFPANKGFVCYQNMLGKMARILQGGQYLEVDLKNCHFEILRSMFDHYKAFASYCDARDEILASVSSSTGCPKWQAKTLFIILIYGGSVDTWRKEFNIPEDAPLPDIVREVVAAVNGVKGELGDKTWFKKFVLAASNKDPTCERKWANTALSFWLQDLERGVVTAAISHVQDSGVEVGCVKHDGFLVKACDRNKIDLERLAEHCKSSTGLDLKFDIKDQALDEEDKQWKKMVEDGWNDPHVAKSNLSELTKRVVVAADEGAQAHLAAIFKEKTPDSLAYLGRELGWFYFSSPRWVYAGRDTEFLSNLVMDLLVPIVKAAITELEEAGLEFKAERGVLRFLNGRKAGLVEELQRLYIVTDPKGWFESLDSNPHVFGLEDCVFDIKLGGFREGKPGDMVSFSCGHKRSDLEECPNICEILEAIRSMFPSEPVFEYVIGVLASAISGDRVNQDFNIWSGCGANGKGLVKALCRVAFGDYFYEADAALFFSRSATKSSGAEPDKIKMKGRRLIITSEGEAGDTLRVGFLKNATGGDLIVARNLFSSSYTSFQCMAYIVMCFNKIPSFTDDSKGMARRTRLVDFPFEFVDEPKTEMQKPIDRGLQDKFKDPKLGAAFLSLLMKRFMTSGHNIQVPEEVVLSSTEFVNSNNTIVEILEDLCEAGENYSVTLKELWDAIPARKKEREGIKRYSLKKSLANSGKCVSLLDGYPILRGYRLREELGSPIEN